MTSLVAPASSLNREHASQLAGFAAATIAVTALIGQWAGLPMLSNWGSGSPTMRPLGALLLAALGLALVNHSRFAFAVGLAVAALAVLGLSLVGAAVLFNVEFGIIDRWLAWWAVAPGLGVAAFQVASAATVTFGLVAGALALSRFERHRLTATLLAGLAGSIAMFALLGYLTGIDTLYGSVSLNSPPLPTAVGLLCVTAGIILRIGTMPVFRKSRPLWHLLVMLGCAIIGPLLLYGAYAGFRFTDAQLREVRENLAVEARTLSANIDREILGEIDRLQGLAASRSLHEKDFAEFQRQAEASLALRRSGNVVLIGRDMQQLVNTAVPFGKPLPKAGAPVATERAFATSRPQVSDLFLTPVTQRLVVIVIVPVQIRGENRYALAKSPEQRMFARLVAAKELPAGWQAVISDATHRIIEQSGNQHTLIGQELLPALRHRPEPGVFEFIDSAGRPSLGASTKSELTGWETAAWAPKAVLEAPVRVRWRTLGAIALLAIALVAASAFWLGRTITRSVGHAARTAVALGEGGPMPVSATPIAEVDTLMAELRGPRRADMQRSVTCRRAKISCSSPSMQPNSDGGNSIRCAA